MIITETFPAPETKAGKLFWLPAYVRLSRSVYDTYTKTGEFSERARHISNCASRWGVSRACAEALLQDTAKFETNDETVTIIRTIPEE